MAIKQIYTLSDSKVSNFLTPFYVENEAMAIRNIASHFHPSANPESMILQHPQDFDLYYLGEYDTDTGKFETVPPKHISNLVQIRDRYLKEMEK